jgi:hypothetical protein
MWKTGVFYVVYGAANLGLVLYGLLALLNPQVLTNSFSVRVYDFPPDASAVLAYLSALYRLLGYFNLLVGSLGLWLLWRHRLDPQSWLIHTAIAVPLLAYLAPIIFDNTVGHIGFFEILEHLLFTAMFAVGIFHVFKRKDDIGKDRYPNS